MLGRIILSIIILLAPSVYAQDTARYFDASRWAAEIAAFEKTETDNPTAHGGIVFVGSSSIKYWHKDLADAMAPLEVTPRGFGGSTMYDVLINADRLIIKHQPKALVLYEGDNDIGQYHVSPQTVQDLFLDLAVLLQEALPDLHIYVLSIKPSPARMAQWPAMNHGNRLLKEACDRDAALTFIDVATPMFNKDGTLKRDLFDRDGLHMNDRGYALWREIIRPRLLQDYHPR